MNEGPNGRIRTTVMPHDMLTNNQKKNHEDRNLPEPTSDDQAAAHAFLNFVLLTRKLRNECPWDREQTHESLRPMLLEETYETLEAIESKDYTELKKELGDLLLHILFHSELGSESREFQLHEVIQGEMDKLVYRHPHVFGEAAAKDANAVKERWERLKRKESGRTSALDGVPKELPALQRASRIQDKAAKTGFDWPNSKSVWKKVREEVEELHSEVEAAHLPNDRERVIDEFGDLLFALVNYARHLHIDPEGALRQATSKFEKRFRTLESKVEATGRPITEHSLEELDAVWSTVKQESAS